MNNIIKAEDYQGTSIYDALISSGKSEEIIRETIANNLRKGLITSDQFNKANAQLDDLIKAGKKTGAGSRGGHVIGYTKSGKPVYKGKDQAHAKEYKDFTHQDHIDASKLHADESYGHHGTMMRSGHEAHVRYARAMHQHHVDASSSHAKMASDMKSRDHEKSISPDEKKIIAAQKKKQIEHHDKMRNFHNKIANDIISSYKDFHTNAHQDEKDVWQHHANQAAHHHRELERLEKE